MKNKLEFYIKKDARLIKVNELARECYKKGGELVHNYSHALWDTEKAIIIGENEGNVNFSVLISSGLMHDSGVAIGPYKDHAINGSKIIRKEFPKLDFRGEEIDKIALAVEEHDGFIHTLLESKILYDADVLNKAGAHGIHQYILVAYEMGITLPRLAQKVIKSPKSPQREIKTLSKRIEKGYYTETATKIDKNLGNEKYSGLELTLEFWKTFDKLLKEGKMKEHEIINKTYKILGIGALR